MADDDNESALLTRQQREFLEGERDDISDPYERKLQVRIRRRVRNGVLDAATVFRSDRLREKDIREIFKVSPSHFIDQPEIANGIVHFLALIYWGICLNDEGDDDTTPADGFAGQIQQGIEMALCRQGVDVEKVAVNIDIKVAGQIEDLTPRELAEGYAPTQLREMLFNGVISDEEFAEAVTLQKEWAEDSGDEKD